jgi:hypothetical protein
MPIVHGFRFDLPLYVLSAGGDSAAIEAEGVKHGCLYTDQDLAERAAAEALAAGLTTEDLKVIPILTDNIFITALGEWRINDIHSVVFDAPLVRGPARGTRFISITDVLCALAAD